MIISGVTILQGVEFPIFLLIFAWTLKQCSAALPVIAAYSVVTRGRTYVTELFSPK